MITERMLVLAMAAEDEAWVAGRHPSDRSYRRMRNARDALDKAIEELEKPHPLSRKGWKKLSRKRQLAIINSMGEATVRAWSLENIHIERMLEGMWDALDTIQSTLEAP